MRRDLNIDVCPRCGSSHRYLLDVDVVQKEEGDATSRAVTRSRVFECPDTQLGFEHRFTLDRPPGMKILEVRVLRLLAEGEQPVLHPAPALSQAAGSRSRSTSGSSVVGEEGQRETRVFISYSRADQRIVTPIVQILRAVGLGVFHDVDSISFGKRWRPVIESSIGQSTVVVVFWCDHARQSAEVRKEWQLAVRSGKDLVPMLLDDTPLDSDLAEFQALDLRSLASVHEGRPVDASRMFEDLTNARQPAVLLPEVAEAVASRVVEFLAQRRVTST